MRLPLGKQDKAGSTSLAKPAIEVFRRARRVKPALSAAARRALWTACVASVLCIFWSLHAAQYTSRTGADRSTAVWLPAWRAVEGLELRLFDARFVARGARIPRSRDRLAIVAIDENSLERVGVWPWPRRMHADLINKLNAAGARVVALDIDFSSRQNPRTTSIGAVDSQEPILSPDDRALAAAAEKGNVLAPSFLSVGQSNGAVAVSLVSPFEELDEAMPDLSLAEVRRDSDEGVRWWPTHAVFNDGSDSRAVVGSFAQLAVAVAQKRVGEDPTTYENDLTKSVARPSRDWASQSTVEIPRIEGVRISPDAPRISRTLVHFWGPPGTIPTHSYADVLESMTAQQRRAAFNNRIVFIGATAHILKDNFPMPQIASHGASASVIPGVELHATMAAMLLDGAFLREATLGQNLAVLWVLSFLMAFAMLALRERTGLWARALQSWWRAHGHKGSIHDAVWLGITFGAVALPLLVFWFAGQWAFNAGFYLPTAFVLLAAGSAAACVIARNFAEEAAERRKALAQFGRMVSPEVLDEILAHPEEEFPRSRRIAATVLFADLEGFTTYSENHEPEEVVDALNELFGRLEPVVYEHGGTVDKYIGDAIMAYFGAPVPRFDHAARALHCAIAMQEATLLFREETGIEFYLRVGLHSGDVIVGCVGSAERSDYTVIGDTVNLASRLEGKNKEFSSWIMCSEATINAAPGVARAESARAQIKGKAEAVNVYIVRGLSNVAPCDTRWGRIAAPDESPEIASAPMPALAAPHRSTVNSADAKGTVEFDRTSGEL
ncbi:MAG TPA: adenylate/guanylate cyclase domain-containing protein [Abditibacteriaceae bacterium]